MDSDHRHLTEQGWLSIGVGGDDDDDVDEEDADNGDDDDNNDNEDDEADDYGDANGAAEDNGRLRGRQLYCFRFVLAMFLLSFSMDRGQRRGDRARWETGRFRRQERTGERTGDRAGKETG